MSTSERIPAQQVVTVEEALAHGTLVVRGRITGASNAVLYATAELHGRQVPCVYKPAAGERPLWDFPDGTLAQREVAAYEVSRALGWDLVPPTVLRDGPHGEGMCQLWVGPTPDVEDAGEAEDVEDTGEGGEDEGGEDEGGEEQLLALVDSEEPGPGWKAIGFAEVGPGRTALLVHADDERLRRLAALDAVINNGDRKGGHLLPLADGRLYAIDHGVTFHTEDKLRTLLWGWAGEPLPEPVVAALKRLAARLVDGSPLGDRLAELITYDEREALRARTGTLLRRGRYPQPSGEWPPIPYPLV